MLFPTLRQKLRGARHRLRLWRRVVRAFPRSSLLPWLGRAKFRATRAVGLSRELRGIARDLSYSVESFAAAPDRKSRILFCSIFLGEQYRRDLHHCLESRRNYCREQGYDFALLTEMPPGFARPAPWLKLPFLYRLMADGYEKIFFLDADALITNSSIRLEAFFDEILRAGREKSLYFCIDSASVFINSGSFFLKTNAAAQYFLDLVWRQETFIHSPWWENEAIVELERFQPGVRRILLLTEESRRFNAFPLYEKTVKVEDCWRPGDFLIHFAGFRGARLLAEIEKHAPQAGGPGAARRH